jgi:RNA polymerase sigma factor (sigma-70 family)
MNESELLSRLKQKDRTALRLFYEKYSLMVYQVCIRLLRNTQDAEDVTKDVFLKAYYSIPKFQGKSKLSTWLYRIAVNTCLNFMRQKKVNQFLSLDFLLKESSDEPILLEDESQNLENNYEKKEDILIVQTAIHSLPTNLRIPLILQLYKGLPHKEISEILDCSISAVESRIFRAKKNWR